MQPGNAFERKNALVVLKKSSVSPVICKSSARDESTSSRVVQLLSDRVVFMIHSNP